MLPDFIIPGAGKAGSKTLASYLIQHPDIYMPPGYEIHFFNNDLHYRKGIAFYEKFFDKALPGQVKGEKTPRYSEYFVPRRMAQYLPDVKLIWMFRNPVYRAYSHYKMYIWEGVEDLSFEEALKC